jgi:hypothetical protein
LVYDLDWTTALIAEADDGSRPDDENPEWTVDDFQNARPALEIVAGVSRMNEVLRLHMPKPDQPK